MIIGIVGLGLIGGSLAKAFSQMTDHTVLGADISNTALLGAKLTESVDGELTSKNMKNCDVVFVTLYPQATIDFVKKNAVNFKKEAIIIDCCGIKRDICASLLPVAEKNGFAFVGGHPMAGTQSWGFEHSRDSLFKGASMILTSTDSLDIVSLEKLKKLFESVGFANIQFSTPEEHDEVIAFTSQLAHIVSNAYVKSPTAQKHKGFSAGSYKDMTRVANLNDEMWTEIFIENGDFLSAEIDTLIENLKKYSTAVKAKDENTLRSLLVEGKESKQTVK